MNTKPLLRFILIIGITALAGCKGSRKENVSTQMIGQGLLPDIWVGKDRIIHLVYGKGDSILYTHSSDGGKHFSQPLLVDTLPGLVLIAKRGPQIAASKDALVILAINKAGNIFYYRKKQQETGWQKKGIVNDVPEVAKEAFMDVSSDKDHTFYATWLDIRGDRHNKIAGARSIDNGKSWQPNQILYASPDGVVCPCCKPSVAMQGNQVYVMFRNWLNGARDMYVLHSTNGGQSFGQAHRLGVGTWKLDACPMDGGGLGVNKKGKVFTAWMREGSIFTSGLSSPEQFLTKGSNCKLAVQGQTLFVSWLENDSIRCTIPTQTTLTIGKGKDASLGALDKQKAICVWDDGKHIFASHLQWNNG